MTAESDELAAKRRELLALLLEEEGLTGAGKPDDGPVARGGGGEAPLSSAQQRVWFFQQLDPGSAVYNLSVGMRLTGPLDVDALRDAIAHVADRHEVLRTTYHQTADGTPVQRVHAALPIPVPAVDADGEDAALAAARRAGRRPFDLSADAPLRALLVRLAPGVHLAVLVVHHIACDDLTWAVLLPEIAGAYAALAEGGTPRLPELPVQYADYAAWEQGRLAAGAMEEQAAYWVERLTPPPPRTALPLDRPRPGSAGPEAGEASLPLPAPVSAAVRDLARACGTTPFMALLAAFAVLLHRSTRETDIAVGTPAVLREDAQLQGLVGNFVNTLVMRIDLDGDPTFREVLRRVQQVCAEAYAHQEVPFDRVVEQVQPRRLPGRGPVFDVMFLLFAPTLAGVSLPGLDVAEMHLHNGTTQFDVTMAVLNGDDGFTPTVIYRTELFDPGSAEQLLANYAALLAGVTAHPDLPIGRVALRPAGGEPPAAAGLDGPPRTLPELFADVVAAHADRTAVVCGDARLTYRELDRRADALAGELVRRGAGPGGLVALLVPRSADFVAALLAVLKSGAAYVPLDPDQPAERLALIVEDARPALVVTTAGLASAVPYGTAALLLSDVGESDVGESQIGEPDPGESDNGESDNGGTGIGGMDVGGTGVGSPDRPPGPADTDPTDTDPAYVIYTSGSTGRPKGVLVSHRNVVRLFTGTAPWYGFGPDDVWTLFHSGAFDFSVWEIWGALLHGGRLVVVPQDLTRGPEEFLDLLAAERVTVLNQTPSAFAQLMRAEAESPRGDLALRYVIFGGEALDLPALRAWYDRHPDDTPRLVNMYGITETTVHVTWLPLDRETAVSATGSLIGRPLPDLRVHVLDEAGQPVPVGIVGEMYVSGPGVALGYLNRPDLDRGRFLPDPFTGGRMYRTGDLARLRADGGLEFAGRADEQIKLRGYRIEPGEIESTLRDHPGVADAVVLLDGERLAAHLVAAPGERPAAGALREHAAARLPAYMVPAAFAWHGALPLTPHGKLDRRVLAAAATAAEVSGAAHVAARDALEEDISRIWREALGRERVSVDDNFFDLGGHSLLLAKIRPLLERACGHAVPIVDLYTHPTVASLARHLRDERSPDLSSVRERAERQRRVAARMAGTRQSGIRQKGQQ
ncbi:nonribosomal peptide synthetase DhbF [Sinosporangium album]|uniref:Nonribosomal peptide synthetase DhbF n=1 Tax=Sinosporangium album TaxID=504805 RepID=A0A1G8GNJ0_9ACTN|nr:non-ribosomal peptide synthetase [Sinosporangium album]SDH95965.1 nonribosomal peptide synthetase DhbF [Sinosporangium album]